MQIKPRDLHNRYKGSAGFLLGIDSFLHGIAVRRFCIQMRFAQSVIINSPRLARSCLLLMEQAV